MIDNAQWQAILTTATDLSVVCEIYAANATPSGSGFDPANALGCYAAVHGITFAGEDYACLVRKFGAVNRTIGTEANSTSVDFTNLDNQISDFEFNHGFEGLIMVIRLISRLQSTSLALSQILFTGVCEKPTAGSKTNLTVKANWILHGLDVQIPRRKYTPNDQEGRTIDDPEFEGFPIMPQTGTTGYSVRVRRGGIAGFFGFKKTVIKTLHWSSYSDLDANKTVPEVFGIAQISFTHIGYADVGTYLKMRSAVCEGEIYDITHIKSTDTRLTIDAGTLVVVKGKVGTLNVDDPTWVAPGYYSRTAYIRARANNSTIDAADPAPEVVGLVYGRLMTLPNGSGSWVLTDEWTDNPAAITRFILLSDDYFKLHPNWVNDASAAECYQFNEAYIIDRSLSDFIYSVPG